MKSITRTMLAGSLATLALIFGGVVFMLGLTIPGIAFVIVGLYPYGWACSIPRVSYGRTAVAA